MEFEEKYIAFIDIMGFKELVVEAEERNDASQAITSIRTLSNIPQQHIQKDGQTTLPSLPRIKDDLSFQITQISDCVIISSEKSPSGLANVLDACRIILGRQTRKNHRLVRGYLTKGKVIHTSDLLLGSGYHKALEGEKNAHGIIDGQIFEGAPVIEVDRAIGEDVKGYNEQLLTRIFDRIVLEKNSILNIDAWKIFANNFTQSGCAKKDIESLKMLRKNIESIQFPTSSSQDAVKKIEYGKALVSMWLTSCDQRIENCERMLRPFNSKKMYEISPSILNTDSL